MSLCLEEPYNPYQKEFGGFKINFRADLTEAEKISVYPDEDTLRNVILNDMVEGIGIAYVPNETENSFYLAASFELAYKLTIINRYYFNKVKFIDSISLNSTSDALDMARSERPVILLLGPSRTNVTAVTVRDYLITAEGGSFTETDRKYTDLDLTVDKILLVLMREVSI
jgi:hypothetical protein